MESRRILLDSKFVLSRCVYLHFSWCWDRWDSQEQAFTCLVGRLGPDPGTLGLREAFKVMVRDILVVIFVCFQEFTCHRRRGPRPIRRQ